ncbi:MAG: nucleoside phosphorylase [Myxococcales bacterium]|nr:nucleoside phosphorylase [Myxococcales bacterium]
MRTAHHLEIEPQDLSGNGELGWYTLLPGSRSRAERIAGRLGQVTRHDNRRGHTVFVGQLPSGVRVAAVPTGMGCPSVDVVVSELLALGCRRFLRVGTAGALQPHIRIGDLVIASGAVRDEAASDAYSPREHPAVADPWMLQALCTASSRLGRTDHTHIGLLHTKDSLYGREFAQGPDAEANRAYMERLTRMGVLASEMEAAHLFVLASVLAGPPTDLGSLMTTAAPLRAGAVCAVIGTPEEGIASAEHEEHAEDRLIEVALAGLDALWALESAPP